MFARVQRRLIEQGMGGTPAGVRDVLKTGATAEDLKTALGVALAVLDSPHQSWRAKRGVVWTLRPDVCLGRVDDAVVFARVATSVRDDLARLRGADSPAEVAEIASEITYGYQGAQSPGTSWSFMVESVRCACEDVPGILDQFYEAPVPADEHTRTVVNALALFSAMCPSLVGRVGGEALSAAVVAWQGDHVGKRWTALEAVMKPVDRVARDTMQRYWTRLKSKLRCDPGKLADGFLRYYQLPDPALSSTEGTRRDAASGRRRRRAVTNIALPPCPRADDPLLLLALRSAALTAQRAVTLRPSLADSVPTAGHAEDLSDALWLRARAILAAHGHVGARWNEQKEREALARVFIKLRAGVPFEALPAKSTTQSRVTEWRASGALTELLQLAERAGLVPAGARPKRRRRRSKF